ncbi:Repeat domain-containing protein [Marininema mesophilum]|uniref:Repeat domain-containing protein n=1 Tax=Marininema mesophilum TaxID=1048340 RepID=A0A1H2YLW6_9BACL|nr:Repeat domain-containing protein [Marininema mesophilum]
MVCPAFSNQTTFAVGSVPQGITNADFNGDGTPDLAVTNLIDNTVSVLLGNGDGTFAPQTTFARWIRRLCSSNYLCCRIWTSRYY